MVQAYTDVPSRSITDGDLTPGLIQAENFNKPQQEKSSTSMRGQKINSEKYRTINQIGRFNLIQIFLAVLLSLVVIHDFLLHYSLMDGSTRSSLQMFLERSAHRPFAFRILAPTAIKVLDEALPSALRIELADTVAPILFEKYVSHFVKERERFAPVMSKRSMEDWSHSEYRSRYVLMVALMFCSLGASILLMYRAAIKLGATSAGAKAAMILYAMVMPTMFLNGGYFYDFIEQLGALALICLVLESRWLLALFTLLLMQLNKETALLMVLYLIPYSLHLNQKRVAMYASLAIALCLVLLASVRFTYSGLPGNVSEWHLPENLEFWSVPEHWLRLWDFYSIGTDFPRMTFLIFSAFVLTVGWRSSITPTLIAATVSVLTLGGLLVTMGYQDEFRNMSLALPFLILLLFEKSTNALKAQPTVTGVPRGSLVSSTQA